MEHFSEVGTPEMKYFLSETLEALKDTIQHDKIKLFLQAKEQECFMINLRQPLRKLGIKSGLLEGPISVLE